MNKNKLFKKLFFASIMLISSIIHAQSITVTGTVTDASGPLPGANVIVKGANVGATTDFDGNYTLNNIASDAILSISYVGYIAQEVNVDGRAIINVSLVENASQLDEVIVVGYTSQVKGELTGAVSSVDMDEALKAPTVNAAESLQGRVTGVTVVSSGQPGAAPKITIRGFGTSNNANPLYIIDGVQTLDPNILNSINSSDIKQMNVLKDAAAAIYGARASNGVIIVTTKTGGYNMEKATLSVDVYSGVSQAYNLPSVLNPQQHGEMIFQSLRNDGASVEHAQYGSGASPVVPTSLLGAPVSTTVAPGGTKWLDEITQVAPTSSASISLQNGTESGKYYMSVGYLKRDGIQIHTGFERATTMLNSEFKIKNKVRIGEHLNVSLSNRKDGRDFSNAIRMSPIIPVRDDNGVFAGTYAASLGLSNTGNPVAGLYRNRENFNKSFRAFGDVYMEVDLLDELTFKSTLGGNLEMYDGRSFSAKNPEHSEPKQSNSLTESDYNTYNWTWTNTFNYVKSFGDHSINALIGIEAVEGGTKAKSITSTGYLFETADYYLLSNGSGTPNVNVVDGDGNFLTYDIKNSLFSIFGTVNYSYQGKYLATATLRRDESSRFAGDNKSDIFPSFSAGWIVSKEDFFPEDALVSNLKIKGSWGQMGNQTLPVTNPTINISILDNQYADYALNGSSISTGAILSQVGNADLKWETSVSTNLGVDVGLFDNKLNVSLDYYSVDTEDLITFDNSLISTTAIDANPPLVNLGSVKNSGFELGVGYSNTTDSGWSYGINANLSKNENEVTDLISEFQPGRDNFRGGAVTRTAVGRPISSFYGKVVEGVFSSEAEVAAHADQGFTSDAEGVGRFKYKDVNGDGTIGDEDRDYIGSPHADFTYGINLSSAYKGVDVSLFFTGSQGNEVYNYEKVLSDFPTFFNSNRSTRVLDSWTPTNTDASLPALSTRLVNSETQPNSYFVEDASFFRLKNVQIGYTFPTTISDKIGMDSFRLYVQATNLFTLTGYDGVDPEINSPWDNLTLGVDDNSYPLSQIFSIGLNIKF
jgi:TonB-linked SusC/RagA family outer membrane protein